MENLIKIACLLLPFLSNQVCAQIRFGIKAGANSSTSAGSGPALANYNAVWNWQAGVTAEIPISDVLSIQPSILYFKAGNILTEPLIRVDPVKPQYIDAVTYATRVSYLKLPVVAILKASINENTKLFAGIGPYAAIALRVKLDKDYEFNGTSQQRTGSTILNVDDNIHYSRFDYGLSGTAGFEFYKYMQVGVTYDYGLANVSGKYRNVNTFNRSMSFSVGYFF